MLLTNQFYKIRSAATAVTDLPCTLKGIQDTAQAQALWALGKQAEQALRQRHLSGKNQVPIPRKYFDDPRFMNLPILQFSSVQSLSHVRLFATPWTAAQPGLPVHHQLLEFNSNSCPLSW